MRDTRFGKKNWMQTNTIETSMSHVTKKDQNLFKF